MLNTNIESVKIQCEGVAAGEKMLVELCASLWTEELPVDNPNAGAPNSRQLHTRQPIWDALRPTRIVTFPFNRTPKTVVRASLAGRQKAL
jgi:hypothetical protein